MKNVKLYNVIFPVWLLWLFPLTWVVVLPANFAIDLAVIVITLKALKVNDVKQTAKSVILKTWIFGFIADFIGTACMFLANVIEFDYNSNVGRWFYENISSAVSFNPFTSIFALLWVSVCVLISAVCIYFFNYKICFKKVAIENAVKKRLALMLAVFTAPYLFYLPTQWVYQSSFL